MNFTVLIEADFAQSNYAGYIPELRISAVGDTEEEVMVILQDMIQMELDRGAIMSVNRFELRTLHLPDNVKGGEIKRWT